MVNVSPSSRAMPRTTLRSSTEKPSPARATTSWPRRLPSHSTDTAGQQPMPGTSMVSRSCRATASRSASTTALAGNPMQAVTRPSTTIAATSAASAWAACSTAPPMAESSSE
jgi:hypothetical protein